MSSKVTPSVKKVQRIGPRVQRNLFLSTLCFLIWIYSCTQKHSWKICVRAYIRKVHSIFPFLHLDTVRSNKALRPVIAAVGSLAFDSQKVQAQGRQLLNLVNNSVRAQFTKSIDKASQDLCTLLQAAVLLQCAVMTFSIEIKYDEAYEMHSLIAACAQKFEYFAARHNQISEHKPSVQQKSKWST